MHPKLFNLGFFPFEIILVSYIGFIPMAKLLYICHNFRDFGLHVGAEICDELISKFF